MPETINKIRFPWFGVGQYIVFGMAIVTLVRIIFVRNYNDLEVDDYAVVD